MSSFTSSAQLRAFRPLGNNKTTSVLTTTAPLAITISDFPFGTRALRVVNSGTDVTFVEIAQAGVSIPATATSMPLLGNTVEVFTITNENTLFRVIGLAGGNTVYITPGEGM